MGSAVSSNEAGEFPKGTFGVTVSPLLGQLLASDLVNLHRGLPRVPAPEFRSLVEEHMANREQRAARQEPAHAKREGEEEQRKLVHAKREEEEQLQRQLFHSRGYEEGFRDGQHKWTEDIYNAELDSLRSQIDRAAEERDRLEKLEEDTVAAVSRQFADVERLVRVQPPPLASMCLAEKAAVQSCYADPAKDVLDCGELARNFQTCAKNATAAAQRQDD